MSNENKLIEKDQNVNSNFENDLKMAEMKKELLKSFSNYQKTITFMTADAPISVLCLHPSIEKILLANGLLRVYDLIDVDFVKIERLSKAQIRNLTTCLNQFLAMS